MRTPEKLLFKKKIVATLYQFSYETPWASAKTKFIDKSLAIKLENITTFTMWNFKREEMDLPDSNDEEILWEKKLTELGLTHEDLNLDKDKFWSVICNDRIIDDVHSIRLTNGVLEWRT